MRYESAVLDARGAHPGIFGLANGLARSGTLSAADWAWWRASNDWYDAAYRDPATVDPTLFDRGRHPAVTCWFRASAEPLLCRVPGHLELLDRYGIGWRERHSADPGVVRYADADQVVVTPYPLVAVDGGLPPSDAGRRVPR
ncbi:MAG TPA: hypothetical protein VF612_15130 [Jatrophihabitans sp.]|uniref:hypothetical protein n=1 Tax=Jatrophihabitans sp. TaxID=1932789 RepID=UPI002EEAA4B8